MEQRATERGEVEEEETQSSVRSHLFNGNGFPRRAKLPPASFHRISGLLTDSADVKRQCEPRKNSTCDLIYVFGERLAILLKRSETNENGFDFYRNAIVNFLREHKNFTFLFIPLSII